MLNKNSDDAFSIYNNPQLYDDIMWWKEDDISFWQSIVKKYNKSKFDIGDGLEIFSVSLDKDKSRWSKAIKDDNLYWDYHVSDLKGWSSDAAFLYNIKSIPSIFIIDKNGFIQAKNLRGNNLDTFLEKHVLK